MRKQTLDKLKQVHERYWQYLSAESESADESEAQCALEIAIGELVLETSQLFPDIEVPEEAKKVAEIARLLFNAAQGIGGPVQ